jgi:hypothetical protein
MNHHFRFDKMLHGWSPQVRSPRGSLQTNGRSLQHLYTSWLVVSNPPKNISQLGLLFPIYGKIKKCSKPPTSNILVCYILRSPLVLWDPGAHCRWIGRKILGRAPSLRVISRYFKHVNVKFQILYTDMALGPNLFLLEFDITAVGYRPT